MYALNVVLSVHIYALTVILLVHICPSIYRWGSNLPFLWEVITPSISWKWHANSLLQSFFSHHNPKSPTPSPTIITNIMILLSIAFVRCLDLSTAHHLPVLKPTNYFSDPLNGIRSISVIYSEEVALSFLDRKKVSVWSAFDLLMEFLQI